VPANGADGFTKATVQSYRAEIEARGLSASAVNVQLAAVWRGRNIAIILIRTKPNRLIDLQIYAPACLEHTPTMTLACSTSLPNSPDQSTGE
jgi:hypothetical protein